MSRNASSVCVGSLRILNNTYITALATKQIARKVSFPSCLIEHIPLPQIKITKEIAKIKQVLKENGYQQSIICKIFNRIANSHSPFQSQQLMQATDIKEVEIRISIKLPYVEVTSEKLLHILRSHKIRSTFYTKCTLCKLPCKPKD